MKEYKINDSNKLIVRKNKIEDEKGDALLCWAAIDLRNGPNSFYRIHKKAGSQVMGSIILFEPHLKQSCAFTSIPGLLDFYTIIHSILPIHPGLYNDSFFNIIRTIKRYQEFDICRDIYMSFPVENKTLILDHLLTYTELLSNFSFFIIVENDKDYDETISILNKKIKTSWIDRLTKKILGLIN